MAETTESNPFTPGAGLSPPYLAGRDEEQTQIGELLAATQRDADDRILAAMRPLEPPKTGWRRSARDKVPGPATTAGSSKASGSRLLEGVKNLFSRRA